MNEIIKINNHNLKCLKCLNKGKIIKIENNSDTPNNNNNDTPSDITSNITLETTIIKNNKQYFNVIKFKEYSQDNKDDNKDDNDCDCIFFNINHCLYCNNSYILTFKDPLLVTEQNEQEQELIFICPNYCPKNEFKRNLVNVNTTIPPWNRTLLHTAIQIYDVELTWNLLLKGANPFLKDYRGVTPIDLAHSMLQTLNLTSKLTSQKNKTHQLIKRLNQIISILPSKLQSQSQISSLQIINESTTTTTTTTTTNSIFSSLPLPPSANRIVSEDTGVKNKSNHQNIKTPFELNLPLPSGIIRSITESSTHNELHKPNIKKLESNLQKGIQIFTPLTLVRLTSEADGIASTINTIVEERKQSQQEQEQEQKNTVVNNNDEIDSLNEMNSLFEDFVFNPTTLDYNNNSNSINAEFKNKNNSINITDSSIDLLDWKLSELKKAIAQESDIEETIEFKTGTYVCSACMDEIPSLLLGYTCRTLGCSGALCIECFTQLAYVIISSALYAVPVLRCPGGCLCRIPTKVWKTVLSNQIATGVIYDMRTNYNLNDVGSILYEKYSENAEALMKLRCGSCHVTCPLFLSDNNSHDIPTTFEKRMQLIEDIIQPLEKFEQLTFFRTWLLFNAGKISTDVFTSTIYDLFADKVLDDGDRTLCEMGVYSPLEIYFTPILLLFCDIERRLCSQLGLFRKFPKIQTTCCSENHCFMCKVNGHHEGLTCEEVQANEIGIDAQYCPACGVPTLRTEGCNHIVCVCGQEWEWEGDSYY